MVRITQVQSAEMGHVQRKWDNSAANTHTTHPTNLKSRRHLRSPSNGANWEPTWPVWPKLVVGCATFELQKRLGTKLSQLHQLGVKQVLVLL
jgi:hypothetical protein